MPCVDRGDDVAGEIVVRPAAEGDVGGDRAAEIFVRDMALIRSATWVRSASPVSTWWPETLMSILLFLF